MEKGLFASLFDFNISELITPKIIRVLYIIGVVMISIVSVVVFIIGLAQGGVGILMALIGAPLMFILYIIFLRVNMELLIVLFNIHRELKDIRQKVVSQ
jgi:type IV secretory pathway VirB3-like protein